MSNERVFGIVGARASKPRLFEKNKKTKSLTAVAQLSTAGNVGGRFTLGPAGPGEESKESVVRYQEIEEKNYLEESQRRIQKCEHRGKQTNGRSGESGLERRPMTSN